MPGFASALSGRSQIQHELHIGDACSFRLGGRAGCTDRQPAHVA
jgi:hypothetical protein